MRKSYWIGAGVLLLAAFVAFGTGVVTRSFRPLPNTDGTINSAYPNGDKDAGDTLTCDISGLASLVGTEVGTPTSVNVRQFIGGSDAAIVAAATLAIETVSGDDAATEGWAISGDNLTHPGLQTGSGSLRVVASHASVSVDADCTPVSWSYVAQAPVTPSDWEYVATDDGLDNGTGAGDWVAFPDYTLQADDATVISNGYLQVTASATHGFGGISSHHATPTFTAGVSYDLTVTVASGTTWTSAVVTINNGPTVALPVTAGAHDVSAVAGSGSNSLVIHANGGATVGQVLRLTSITLDAVADVFNFQQSSYSGVETDTSINYAVTRTLPTNNAATVNVAITAGGSFATNNNATLSWLANEGGAKTGSIDPSADGSVTLTISSPSVGVLGTQTTTTVTISAESGEQTFPILGSYWLSLRNDLGSSNYLLSYGLPAGQAILQRYDFNVIAGWPEMQAQGGTSRQAIATGAAPSKIFTYFDSEGIYKPTYTTNFATLRTHLTSTNNWRLYFTGTTGTPLDSYYGNNAWAINVTPFSPVDASGLKPMEYMAGHVGSWVIDGAENNTAAPAGAGLYIDNLLGASNGLRVSGDWNRDGVTDDTTNATVMSWYRQGIALGVARFRTLYPTKEILGNLAEFVNLSSVQSQAPEYYRIFDGGVIEWAIAKDVSYSADTFLGFSTLVSRLQGIEDAMLNPAVTCVHGIVQDGTTQEFRYALATTLVGTNMALCWGEDPAHQVWDDYAEYAFDLGTASEARQTGAEANGVWRRDFQFGIAVACPLNVTGTLTLGATMYALQGAASGWLTPGQSVTSVTCPAGGRNGIILSRTPTASAFLWRSPLERAVNDDVYEYERYREAA